MLSVGLVVDMCWHSGSMNSTGPAARPFQGLKGRSDNVSINDYCRQFSQAEMSDDRENVCLTRPKPITVACLVIRQWQGC